MMGSSPQWEGNDNTRAWEIDSVSRVFVFFAKEKMSRGRGDTSREGAKTQREEGICRKRSTGVPEKRRFTKRRTIVDRLLLS
jgi:hypothetical protein